MTSCANCEKEGEHWHHIVPKSRGGSDSPNNLVLLCLDCHSKAHDVSFKGKNGLVKESLSELKVSMKEACKWADKNEDLLHDFMMDLYDSGEDTLYGWLLCSLEIGNLRALDLRNILEGRKFKSGVCSLGMAKRLSQRWEEFTLG